MRNFLIHTGIIIVAVFLLDFAIGSFLDHRFANSSFEPAAKALDNQYDLVMLGPSEMQNQYVTQIIQDSLGISAYNYGWGGQNIYYQYVILNLIINQSNHIPKYVLYEPSYFDFYDTPGWNTENLDVFYPMYDLDDSLRSTVNLQGWKTSFLMKLMKCFKHNSKIHAYAKQMISHAGSNPCLGYEAVEPTGFNEDLKTAETEVNVHFDEQKIDYFYRLIHLCKKHNIKFIIINAPYYELNNGVVWKARLNQIIEEEGVPFLNYDNDEYFTAHPDLYYNKVHFNKYGSEEYTKKIIPDLKALIIN